MIDILGSFMMLLRPFFVHWQGFNSAEQPEEQEWEARKEKMAQMEAVLMSAMEHENIVRTLKVRILQKDGLHCHVELGVERWSTLSWFAG
jgi:hypothetical protein